MAPSKVCSKVTSSQGGQRGPQMSWNNTNINTVRDNQPSVSTPSPTAQADTISARQLWQIILRTQQVKLDLNLAEISAAWRKCPFPPPPPVTSQSTLTHLPATDPRPTIFALEQQLAGFRRHARAGNSMVLHRGDINVAMSAQAAANAQAATANAHSYVFSINGGANGQTTSNAPIHAHPPGTIHGVQGMTGPSSSGFHAVNSGNAGGCSLPPLQIHRAKESQVPPTSGERPLVRLLAPDQPARALALSRTMSSRRVVTAAYWPYHPVARRPVPYCDCGSLDCFHCHERIMARR
ncbi:hypothetical protein ABOM_001962 [Aspergillus bombycis]|uniref:Uncharacterized protein n=1 Tax=Aspergillus bombycis TaxID=109264 RepID=A0A1F8ABF2_9EURO|nr:hypothetical protein ABOM_001962 [Aspergillus bombycis]OGM48688.1 hypothetical protein ABOM_001962 [Aspergillus bombycis]